MVSLNNNLSRIGTFLIIAFGITITAFWLISSSHFHENSSVLSIGISVDIALLIPFIYFLLIRKSTIPKTTIIPVFVLSLLLAYQIVPDNYQHTLNYIEYLLIPVELTIIGLLIHYVIKIGRGFDRNKSSLSNFPETLKMVLMKAGLKDTFANIVCSEASLFYYTFAGWRKPMSLTENEFSYYKSSGYKSVFIVVLFILPAETFALHYWLMSYNTALAWSLTGISIYSVFFILGDRNSIRHRPIEINESTIKINTGLRWSFELPYTLIEKIELREGDQTSEKFANLSTFGFGNVMILLKEKTKIYGIYGIKKKTEMIALSVDDKPRFIRLLRDKLPDAFS